MSSYEAVLPALSSAVASGAAAILLKHSTRGIKPILVNYIKAAAGSLTLGLIVLVFAWSELVSISLNDLILVAFIGLTGPFIAWFLYIKALSIGDISLVHPIVNTYSLSAMLFNFILLKSPIKIEHVAGALFVVIGIRLLAEKGKRGKFLAPMLLALAVSLIWGLNTVLFKIALARSGPLVLSFLRVFFAFIFMTPAALGQLSGVSIKLKYVGSASLAGLVSDFIGVFLWLLSLKLGEVSVAATISASSPIFSAMFSWSIFGEKISRRRVLGIILTVAGICVVSAT